MVPGAVPKVVAIVGVAVGAARVVFEVVAAVVTVLFAIGALL